MIYDFGVKRTEKDQKYPSTPIYNNDDFPVFGTLLIMTTLICCGSGKIKQ